LVVGKYKAVRAVLGDGARRLHVLHDGGWHRLRPGRGPGGRRTPLHEARPRLASQHGSWHTTTAHRVRFALGVFYVLLCRSVVPRRSLCLCLARLAPPKKT
jgi:hypothetical protein